MITKKIYAAAILLSLTAFAIAANALPPLVTTLSDEFSVPIERFGYAFFAQYFAFAVAATMIATVTRGRFGRSILVASLVGSSLLFLAAPLLTSFYLVVVWFVPLGIAGGFTETQATILAGRIDGNQSSRILSLSQAFYCLGAIIAPQIVSYLLDNKVEWQVSFTIFAGLVGAVGLFTLVIFLLPGAERSPQDPRGNAPKSRWYGGVFPAFALAMFIYVVAEGVVATWLAAYFELRFVQTAAFAARVLSVFWIGVLGGRIVVFALPKRLSLWPALLTSSIVATISFAACAISATPTQAIVSIFVAGLFLGPLWPVLASVARIVTGSERAVAGVVTFGGLGVAVGPFLGSRFIVLFGIGRLFVFVLVCSFLLLIIVYTIYARSRA